MGTYSHGEHVALFGGQPERGEAYPDVLVRGVTAFARSTNLPGLYDVELSTGESLTDVTIGQLSSQAALGRWRVMWLG